MWFFFMLKSGRPAVQETRLYRLPHLQLICSVKHYDCAQHSETALGASQNLQHSHWANLQTPHGHQILAMQLRNFQVALSLLNCWLNFGAIDLCAIVSI